MKPLALIIKHRTKPGERDHVRQVWEQYMVPAVASNPGHTTYFYNFDNADPDVIWAFQVYSSEEASQQFLKTSAYANYVEEVEPMLEGPPSVSALTPIWAKQT